LNLTSHNRDTSRVSSESHEMIEKDNLHQQLGDDYRSDDRSFFFSNKSKSKIYEFDPQTPNLEISPGPSPPDQSQLDSRLNTPQDI